MIQETFEDVLQSQPQPAFSQQRQNGQQQRQRHECQHDIRQTTISFLGKIERKRNEEQGLDCGSPLGVGLRVAITGSVWIRRIGNTRRPLSTPMELDD